jgi:hypothetical protein
MVIHTYTHNSHHSTPTDDDYAYDVVVTSFDPSAITPLNLPLEYTLQTLERHTRVTVDDNTHTFTYVQRIYSSFVICLNDFTCVCLCIYTRTLAHTHVCTSGVPLTREQISSANRTATLRVNAAAALHTSFNSAVSLRMCYMALQHSNDSLHLVIRYVHVHVCVRMCLCVVHV